MVFSLLNFVPDTRHHISRISKRVLGQLFCDRNTVALSVKRDRINLWWVFCVLMLRPDSLSVVLSRWDMGSIARLNSKQERGAPCLTPLVMGNFLLISPFRMMAVSAPVYRDFMVVIRFVGKFIFSSTLQR